MRDLHNRIKVTQEQAPAAIIASNTTKTGATIDTKGFDSLEFLFNIGAITDGTWTLTVYEGDASDMSDEAAVADADLLGLESQVTWTSTDANSTKKIGYKGGKRYVRTKIVTTSITTGGFFSTVAVQSHGVQSGVGSAISP